MKDIFELRNPSYNLRSTCNQFRREHKSVNYGLQPERYIGPKIWELVPNNIKYRNSLNKFMKLIKSWKPEAWPCRLCKTDIIKQRTHLNAAWQRSEGKEKYGFTDNLNDITNLLEEMVEQDELLITWSSSNLNKCDSEQLDVQEETPVVSKFLNNSSKVCGMDKSMKKIVKLLKNLINVVWTVNRTFLIIC